MEAGREVWKRARPKPKRKKAKKKQTEVGVQACRRDMVREGAVVRENKFKLTWASSMSAAVRRLLRDMDPRAEVCEGDGLASCLLNRGLEIEC